jgi:hypothetical protein
MPVREPLSPSHSPSGKIGAKTTTLGVPYYLLTLSFKGVYMINLMRASFILLIISCVSFAGKYMVRQEMDAGEGIKVFVSDPLQKSKSELYSICLDWLSDTYVSPKRVVHQSDREAGLILVKGHYPAQPMIFHSKGVDVFYSLKIQVKDGKVKLSFETGRWGDNGCEVVGNNSYPSIEAVEIMEQHYQELYESLLKKIRTSNDDF